MVINFCDIFQQFGMLSRSDVWFDSVLGKFLGDFRHHTFVHLGKMT